VQTVKQNSIHFVIDKPRVWIDILMNWQHVSVSQSAITHNWSTPCFLLICPDSCHDYDNSSFFWFVRAYLFLSCSPCYTILWLIWNTLLTICCRIVRKLRAYFLAHTSP
jgi:hypothetical protein